MRKIRLAKVLLLALLFCCFFAAAAQALTVNLRNNFRDTIFVVLVYYDLDYDDWWKNGWFEVPAGQTRTVDLPGVHIGTIHYYANSRTHANVWQGGQGSIVQDVVTERMYLPADDTPRGSNRRYINMIRFDFNTETINLNFNP